MVQMRTRTFLTALGALGFLLLAPAPGLRGQEEDNVLIVPQEAEPWHRALELEGDPTAGDLEGRLEAARIELILGRPLRAVRVLESAGRPDSVMGSDELRLLALGKYRLGRFEEAARLFRMAAESGPARTRGLLAAREALALERAGLMERAAGRYREAVRLLPAISPWLRARQARVETDYRKALALLGALAGALPDRYLAGLRGTVLLAAGDSLEAADELEAAGLEARAAAVVLHMGDSVRARELLTHALLHADSTERKAAVRLATTELPPLSGGEHLALARAERQERRFKQAATSARRAAARDSTAAAFLLLGDILSDRRRYREALAAYTTARRLGGEGSVTAGYKRARTLSRIGRLRESTLALKRFADSSPKHPSAPLAMYLVASRTADGGARRRADSLFAVIASRWPTSRYASIARNRLALRAFAKGHPEKALALYRDDARLGRDRRRSEFMLARLLRKMGDTTGYRKHLEAVAVKDSIGYYGTMARRILGMPGPVFDEVVSPPPTHRVEHLLESLDLLTEAGLDTEHQMVLDQILAADSLDVNELLDLSEGLTTRGHPNLGIRLGWRAAAREGLNHTRVVRAVFPWPFRDLIEAEAAKFGIDPYLVVAVIRQESSFMPEAVSRAGAFGLMQLLPVTAVEAARRLGVRWSRRYLTVPDANLHIGTAHLAALIERTGGDEILTAAAYNAGYSPAARWKRYREYGEPAAFIERIPYAETRAYVKTVFRNKDLYRALYPESKEAD